MSLTISLEVDAGGREPIVVSSMSITHNLAPMWLAAGLWPVLHESDGTSAEVVGKAIADKLVVMKDDPERFKKYESPNGWGKYTHAIDWLEGLVAECERAPKAIVRVSR